MKSDKSEPVIDVEELLEWQRCFEACLVTPGFGWEKDAKYRKLLDLRKELQRITKRFGPVRA
jgi:hypothetical protein